MRRQELDRRERRGRDVGGEVVSGPAVWGYIFFSLSRSSVWGSAIECFKRRLHGLYKPRFIVSRFWKVFRRRQDALGAWHPGIAIVGAAVYEIAAAVVSRE